MSDRLVEQIRRFIRNVTPVALFVDEYIDSWRGERDDNSILGDDDRVSEFLSSAFCVVDLYNPSDERKDYEFDEVRLRIELMKLAEEHGVTIV